MPKNRYSTPKKAIAAFLSVLCFCILALSVAAVSLMASGQFYNYSRHRVHQEYYSSQLFAHLSTVVRYYNPYHGDQTLYESPVHSYRNTNLAFTVVDVQAGDIIAKTYQGEPTVYEDEVHFLLEVNTGKTLVTTADPYSKNYEILLSVRGYVLEADDSMEDLFSSTYDLYMIGYTWRYPLIAIAFFSLTALVFLWIYLLYAAGHRKGEDTLRPTLIEKVPFDLFTLCYIAFVIANIFLIIAVLQHGIINVLTISVSLFVALCIYLATLIYSYSFTTRLKIGGLGKQLFFYRLFRFLIKKLLVFIGWVPLLWKSLTILLLCFALDIFMLSFLDHIDQFLLYFVIKNTILAIILLYVVASLRKLQKGGEKIASGDFSYQIDTKYLIGDCEAFAKTLNTIGDGMSTAVSERIKSERLKTELITNVSHDIKTPLTSIINYVDLLKKEDLQNERAAEYLNILDKQSARMKKLILDLVEVSKASTGNIKVEIEECDICVLLQQAAGEYHEKLSAANLEPVMHFSDLPILVMADGNLLWRVFDNLLSNICKYSLPGTRVYLDAAVLEQNCVITFKNISKHPLGVSCDELMERFVRADASRHTEGSGLGLSIAQSLLTLQGGSLSVSSDGDLFKATVLFPLKTN